MSGIGTHRIESAHLAASRYWNFAQNRVNRAAAGQWKTQGHCAGSRARGPGHWTVAIGCVLRRASRPMPDLMPEAETTGQNAWNLAAYGSNPAPLSDSPKCPSFFGRRPNAGSDCSQTVATVRNRKPIKPVHGDHDKLRGSSRLHVRTWRRCVVIADMAELADALGSGLSTRKGVEVQVLLSAPIKTFAAAREGRFYRLG